MFRAFRTCNGQYIMQYRYMLFTSWAVGLCIVKKRVRVAPRCRRLRQHFQVRGHSFSLYGLTYFTPVNNNFFIIFLSLSPSLLGPDSSEGRKSSLLLYPHKRCQQELKTNCQCVSFSLWRKFYSPLTRQIISAILAVCFSLSIGTHIRGKP